MFDIVKASRIATLAALVALVGCSASKPPEKSGSLRVAATVADVSAVTVRIAGAGISTPITATLTLVGGTTDQWSGTITGVPAGTGRTVTAEASNAAAVVIYRAAATNVTVTANQTASVTFTMQDVTPRPGYTNNAPLITASFASNVTPAPGEILTVRVTASDLDGDALAYAWTASGGTFAPVSANVAQLQWTAPAGGGTQTLTVRVTDARGLYAETTITLNVTVPGAMAVNVTANSWPVVTAMTAVPSRVAVGAPVALTATATDDNGDALTVAWATTCTGTFSATTGTSTSFTPTVAPASNECTITATADDGRGGTGSGSVGVWVGLSAIPMTTLPPQGPLGLVNAQYVTTVVNAFPAGGTVRVSLPAPSTAGNMILVVASQNLRQGSVGLADNLGNSYIDGQYLSSTIATALMGTAYSVQAFWLPVCDAGIQSFDVVSDPFNRLMVVAAEFSGVSRVPNPLDQGFTRDVYAAGDGAIFHAGPTGATLFPNELVIAVARSVPTAGLSYSAGTGYALIGGSLMADDNDAFAVEWGVVNTVGPQTADFVQHLSSTVTSSTHHAFAVTFRGD
jgi:hypothetical protein